MSNPKLLDNPIEQKFAALTAKWKAASGVSSSLTERFTHPAYQQIIAIGEPALPYILAELERDPDWWFSALKKISGEDPVPASSRGRLAEMTKAWLDWGRTNGYLV
jgi:hypothetical protein